MTSDPVVQPEAGHLPDVIIKYVRCKKNPMAAWDFFEWEENEEENSLLLQEANAIIDIACILLRKTRRILCHRFR